VIYIVTMYRWGNRERHSYVLGAYSSESIARTAALCEMVRRGGNKYWPEIIACEVDGEGMKTALKLGEEPGE
jgi:hypothetical protein